MAESLRSLAAQKAVGIKIRPPGPYRGQYKTAEGQESLKNRQFGPGSSPKIGKETFLQGPKGTKIFNE